MKLPNIPYDKRLHFLCGFAIALSSIWIGIWGLILAVLAGIFKEVYDYLDYGKYDICDMLATWIGAIAGDLVVQLGQALFL